MAEPKSEDDNSFSNKGQNHREGQNFNTPNSATHDIPAAVHESTSPTAPDDPITRGNGSTNGNSSKKKKRRNRKKPKNPDDLAENDTPSSPKVVDNTFTPAIPSKTPMMSPRKQAIMRYKKSDENLNGQNYINEVKHSLKSKEISVEDAGDMDQRVTLFKFKSSKIFVYDEQLSDTGHSTTGSSGRLLGHGEFEIFQLHNGDVTYLSCGPSFIYPLLPKLKILRISFNQFILPLVNPERYWKIIISSEESNVIQVLENTLERLVKYRNLFFGSKPPVDTTTPRDFLAINEQPTELKSLSIIDETDSPHNFEMHLPGAIPDSPPSAPISPGPPQNGYDHFQTITPTKSHLSRNWINRKASHQSISTSLACLDINNKPEEKTYNEERNYNEEKNHIYQPKPSRLSLYEPLAKSSHWQRKQDEKSDSSMDSLLDEYDENITHTQSRQTSRRPSRSASRQQSIASLAHLPRAIIARSVVTDAPEDFPSTSLSEYNKTHQHHPHHPSMNRSRHSSRSDLYSQDTNWVKLGTTQDMPRLPKSRSTYSINSAPYGKSFDINNTYKNIYRSITSRNLAQYVDDDSRSVHSIQSTRLSTIQANSRSDFSRVPRRDSTAHSVRSERTGSKKSGDMMFDSSEVYRLVSRGKRPAESKGIASKIFGW